MCMYIRLITTATIWTLGVPEWVQGCGVWEFEVLGFRVPGPGWFMVWRHRFSMLCCGLSAFNSVGGFAKVSVAGRLREPYGAPCPKYESRV